MFEQLALLELELVAKHHRQSLATVNYRLSHPIIG